MSLTASEMTPADIAAVTGNSGNGWGGNNDWWILLLFLYGRGGWGTFGGGYGGEGGGGYATQADVQRAVDQQTLISKLDQQTYGLSDATFSLNNTITTGFSNAELSRCNQQAAIMAQLNNMMMADQKCCCETQRLVERGFADTNYNLATQSCETRNTIQNTTRDVLENQNANTRAVLDALTAQRIEAKDEKIAELQSIVASLNLAQSQANQNNYLLNQLRPCPVPAYLTCNPYTASYGYGLNNGCGYGCAA